MNTSKSIINYGKKIASDQKLVIMLVVYFILASLVVPYFFSGNNVVNILIQSSDTIIIACGAMFVLLNGGIDFSITASMGLGSIIGAIIMNTKSGLMQDSPFGFVVAIVVMLAIGVIIGCINGAAVVFLRMPSFMATMATQMIFGGLALFIANSKPINNLPQGFIFIGNEKILGIPFPIILAVVVAIVLGVLLAKTVFGRNIYAIGTNPNTALISGLPVKKTIFKLFIISGVCAAIGGMVTSSRLGAGMPALNADRLLTFYTAIILGGTSIIGGKGTVLGTVFGGLFIAMLTNSMSLLGLRWYIIMGATGIFLFIFALFDALRIIKE